MNPSLSHIELQHAIGALHDQLERSGALSSMNSGDAALTRYHLYRLRRADAAASGLPDSAQTVAYWDDRIAKLDAFASLRGQAPVQPLSAVSEPANDKLAGPLTVPVTVYFEALETVDAVDGPLYCKHEVNQDFVASLCAMRQVCSEHGLTEVRRALSPNRWGSRADALEANGGELVVTPTSFYFAERPHGWECELQTRPKDIDGFTQTVLEAASEPVPVVLLCDEMALDDEELTALDAAQDDAQAERAHQGRG